jgi:hypothetical protein
MKKKEEVKENERKRKRKTMNSMTMESTCWKNKKNNEIMKIPDKLPYKGPIPHE